MYRTMRKHLAKRAKHRLLETSPDLSQLSLDELQALPVEVLDRAAFGINSGDVISIPADKIRPLPDDMINAEHNVYGGNAKMWYRRMLKQPVAVRLELDGFHLEDGHHRYTAARLLRLPVIAIVDIQANPISALRPELPGSEPVVEERDARDERAGRQRGKVLGTSGYVTIYRGVVAHEMRFQPMDYVTLSLRWAKGHASHVAAIEEEPAHVIQASVPRAQVFEAFNPGEYFYDGPEREGRPVAFVKAGG